MWICSRQRDNWCDLHSEAVTREVLENDKELYLVFVDLEKAFDRVLRVLIEVL